VLLAFLSIALELQSSFTTLYFLCAHVSGAATGQRRREAGRWTVHTGIASTDDATRSGSHLIPQCNGRSSPRQNATVSKQLRLILITLDPNYCRCRVHLKTLRKIKRCTPFYSSFSYCDIAMMNCVMDILFSLAFYH